MSMKSIIPFITLGLFSVAGCTSTYKVTANNIHEIPISGRVDDAGDFYHFAVYLKSEGVLNQISSVKCSGGEMAFYNNTYNSNWIRTQFSTKSNFPTKVLKIIVTPPHSAFVRVRTVEIPLQLIHDTFLNNTNVTAFLEGHSDFNAFEDLR
ncbi:hypothetical protein P4B35_23650 [Pontiellaceae bacterium B12227]|nr:hypothetical protein [Pontiellaceae bacterium B12227]